MKPDLVRKHRKMRESPFVFLRATYWRWAEIILDVCPDLAGAEEALAIGDAHLENFGTWRDADGRLTWGVNDFDEAARMPYTLDLVRLAASALLARGRRHMTADAICSSLLEGYEAGLGNPRAIVLDRDHAWLRETVIVPEKERAKFWDKMAAARKKAAPASYRTALDAAMPHPGLGLRVVSRSAGTGSLGRPRWVGIAEWQGAPVVREAKAVVSSAWLRPHGRGSGRIRVAEIANGRFRSWDPWFKLNGRIAVRRLSPNNRKIEADKAVALLLMPDMLRVMGFEIANVHVGTRPSWAEISRDLSKRRGGWLAASANRAVEAVARDYADWAS